MDPKTLIFYNFSFFIKKSLFLYGMIDFVFFLILEK